MLGSHTPGAQSQSRACPGYIVGKQKFPLSPTRCATGAQEGTQHRAQARRDTHKHHEAFHRQNTCLRSTTVLPRRRKLNCAMVTNSCHHLYSSFNSQAWLIETTNRRAKKTLINQHCFLDLSSPLQRVRAVK